MKTVCIEVVIDDENLNPGVDSQIIQIAIKELRLAGFFYFEDLKREIDSIVWNIWQKGYLENESEELRHWRLQKEEDDTRKAFWEKHRIHRKYGNIYVK